MRIRLLEIGTWFGAQSRMSTGQIRIGDFGSETDKLEMHKDYWDPQARSTSTEIDEGSKIIRKKGLVQKSCDKAKG